MDFLMVTQIVVAVLLVFFISIQSKGKGFARTGGANFARRGLERVVFKLTFVLSGLFILISLLSLAL